jgi:hypothetical protein
MGRLAVLTLAASLAVASAGCGGSSLSASDCASIRSLSKLKDRIDREDTRVIGAERRVHTLRDFPIIVAAERQALPTYQTALQQATQGESSTADPYLRSGWSQLAAEARLRVHGVSVVTSAVTNGVVTSSKAEAVKRLSNRVDAANAQWLQTAKRLNDRFRSCGT